MNKKAMEVSINVIVGIILGLLMLTAGIIIFKQIYDRSSQLSLEVDQNIKSTILKSIKTGDLLYVHETDQSIKLGDNTIFYFAIRNIYNEERYFRIEISPQGTPQVSTAYYEGPHLIGAMEDEVFGVIVDTKELPLGTYSALIQIKDCGSDQFCSNAKNYTNSRLIRVTTR